MKNKIKYTGTALLIEKTAPFLAVAHELTIENGIVIDKKVVSRAEDLPAAAIGAASKQLWKQYNGIQK